MTADILNDNHRRVLGMIRHALTLQDDPDTWIALAYVLECRLTPDERAMLLVAVAKAAETEDALLVMERLSVDLSAGSPLPVFEDPVADARWWASLASPAELRAWLAACFAHLPSHEQQDFVAAASRRMAA
jgi:hypothetical protein